MKVLITGSSGLLGSEFLSYCKSNELSFQVVFYSDLCKGYDYLKGVFEGFKPNVVLHCAANTNVEWCESNESECYRDNVILTEDLCKLSQEYQSKFVFFSSTGVYGNKEKRPYTELDLPNPTTVHHKSKLIAEEKVNTITSDYLIIRVGWLFGGATSSKKNFVNNRIKEFANAEGDVSANCEQYGSPTYVIDVVNTTFKLIFVGALGVFNCVGLGYASRFEYVKKIAEIVSFRYKVKPIEAASFSRVANVSNNEMAINERLDTYGVGLNVPWQERLREYIEGIYGKQ